MFFPTKSARMGSSRPPRSTRMARRTLRGRPEAHERGQGGARRAARVEHVVDENHVFPLAGEGQVRLLEAGSPSAGLVQIVAVERHVERAHERMHAHQRLELTRQPFREGHAPRADADEHEVRQVGRALDDLMREAPQGAPELLGVELLHHQGEIRSSGGFRSKRAQKKLHAHRARSAEIKREDGKHLRFLLRRLTGRH